MERRSPWAVALGSCAVVLSSDAVGLGAVRSLQEGGVPTIAVMLDPMEPTRFSRFGHKILVRKTGDVEGAVLQVLSGIQQEPRPVLIPTSDLLAHIVAKHRAHLEERFRCCVPPDAAFDIALDKAKDTRFLEGHVPLPKTAQELPASPAELVRRLGLPIIIKPRTHLDKDGIGWRNVIIRSAADAEEFYRTSTDLFHRVVAQEMIPGPDDALWECIGLFDGNHELVRAFTFRKLATMPAHFGATSRARSERNDALLELAATVGRRVGYIGLGDIDVKYDARDGTFKYLELNPRLGLCHWFGTRCGINLTLDAYRQMCGEEIRDRTPQIDGVPFLAVLEELGGRLHDGDSIAAVLGGLCASLVRRPVGPYFTWNDPLPGPMAVVRIASRFLAKAWRGQLGFSFTKEYARRNA